MLDRHIVSRTFSMPPPLGRIAVEALSLFDPPPKGVRVLRGSVAGRKARLVVPDRAPAAPRVLWIHGGGFAINSPLVYTTLASHLALEMGASVLLPSYRLAPEHPFPAAVDDSLAAYRAVAEVCGPLLLAGNSAGGNLALNAAIGLRDAGEELPLGLLLMSPWVDLTGSGESMGFNEGRDAILRSKELDRKARAYAGALNLSDARLSPLNANLSGLPQTLIQCGGDELLLSEGSELAARMDAADTPVELDLTSGMWHEFQTHASMLAQGAKAVERMAAWAKPLVSR